MSSERANIEMDGNDAIRARSLQFLEEENLDYQTMELPGGVKTPGHDRSYLLDDIFGSDFSGQSYLDIGSYLGYFCLEALRRGAAESTGIETDPTNVRRANRIAELWSLNPTYVEADFETLPLPGKTYDVITCLNVLHHLFDPISALRRMMRMARKRIVLEVEVPPWPKKLRDRLKIGELVGPDSRAIAVGKPNKRGYSTGLTYSFTPQALQVIFNSHTNLFEPIQIKKSPFKERQIVVANKRQVGHLVVVAGPTSAGKSTLSSRLLQDDALQRRFGLEPGEWEFLQARDTRRMSPGRHERVLFHYDILRPTRNSIRSHERDQALDLVKVAERITIITIVTSRDRLRQQLQKGELEREGIVRKEMEKNLKLMQDYLMPHFLHDWYSSWDKFTQTLPNAQRAIAINTGEFERANQASLISALNAVD